MKKTSGIVLSLFLLLACSPKEPPRQPPPAEKPASDETVWNDPAGTRIGVLLPLSGSYGRFGEAALDGIACAAGLFEPCPEPARPIHLVVKDTGGEPEIAAAAAQELIEREKVSGLIGPLLSQQTEAVTSVIKTNSVPTLILAPQKNAKDNDPHLFQHSLVPEKEVAQIVQQSYRQGLHRFILFYPDNSYGRQYQELFATFVKKEGEGKIIKQASYLPDIPDFTDTLRQLLAGLPSSQTTGLFIPDSYQRIIKIAEGLASLSVSHVRLIGTSRWHHPKLLANQLASLEGAIFGTPFFSGSTREAARSFRDSFLSAFGMEPSWLEAIGFDAMRLILEAMQRQGSDAPQKIKEGLLAVQNFAAVTGPLSWDAEGVSEWPLEFLTVENGIFVPLHRHE